MEPKPTLVQLDPRDLQFKFLLTVEKILFGVGLLIGFHFLVQSIPDLAKQISPLFELVTSGIIITGVTDIYGKRKFDQLINRSTVTDDSQPESTN